MHHQKYNNMIYIIEYGTQFQMKNGSMKTNNNKKKKATTCHEKRFPSSSTSKSKAGQTKTLS